ncbi:MAG TPA: glycosyltransferase [Thermodesulfobacteriota bacterium]|nr:glycosyltransferase [Thermodesulfobacteriota bacterium]
MGIRILLGCYEVPGYGGANTASYKLFEIMQSDGLNVSYINLINEKEADYFRYAFGENCGNPKCLDNVYNCVLKGPLFHPHPELADLIDKLSPDILLGIDYLGALLIKRAAPKKRSIFFTAGCEQVRHYAILGKDAIGLGEFIAQTKGVPILLHRFEKETVEISDFILTHSDMIKVFYQYFFPSQNGKIYSDVMWFAEWIYKDALDYSGLQKPFFEREIDIISIASYWCRPEKNYKLIKKIVSQLRDLNIHIVGESEKKLPDAKHHGLITKREDMFKLLGNTKTIVCPSLFDAAPGILFEASAMGCNIVASKNCGNWQICNEKLLVDPFNLNNFLEKITVSLTEKFSDNIDYFLKTESYKNLIGTILVL